MINRIWYGWTTSQNADRYETLLKEEIFVDIHDRRIRGFKGIQLLRRDLNHEVEFITIMNSIRLTQSGSLREKITKPRLSRSRHANYCRTSMNARNTMKSSMSELGSYR